MMADELSQFLQGGLLLIDCNRLSDVQTLFNVLYWAGHSCTASQHERLKLKRHVCTHPRRHIVPHTASGCFYMWNYPQRTSGLNAATWQLQHTQVPWVQLQQGVLDSNSTMPTLMKCQLNRRSCTSYTNRLRHVKSRAGSVLPLRATWIDLPDSQRTDIGCPH